MALNVPVHPESFEELEFPARGIDLSTDLDSQIPGTTPVGKNVRLNEPLTMRARGGSRSGLSKYLADQTLTAGHRIQHLNIIVDPTTDALLSDDSTDPNAVTDPSTNNKSIRNPPPSRKVRKGGSAQQPNRNKKKGKTPKPKITSVSSNFLAFAGGPCVGGAVYFGSGDCTITGTNLGDLTTTVTFGGQAAGVVSNDGSTLIVTTPAGAVSIGVNVAVTTPQGTATATNAWAYTYFNLQSSATLVFGSPVSSGTMLLCFVAIVDQSTDPSAPPAFPTVSSISDSLGNGWTQVGGYQQGTSDEGMVGSQTHYRSSLSLWVASNLSAGANTVTVNVSNGSITAKRVIEYSGPSSSSPLDSNVSNTGSGPALTTTNIGVNTQIDLLVGGFATTEGTAFGIFTPAASDSSGGTGVAYADLGQFAIRNSSAAIAATGTISSGTYMAIGASFRAS